MHANPNLNKLLKNIFYWGLVVLFIVWVFDHLVELKNIFEILERGNPFLIVFAFILQLLSVTLVGYMYRRFLMRLGERIPLYKTTPLIISLTFFSAITPIGAVGAILYFSRKFIGNSKVSFGKMIAAFLLVNLCTNISIAILLIPSLIYLNLYDVALTPFVNISFLIFLSISLLFASGNILAAFRPLLFKKYMFILLSTPGRLKIISKISKTLGSDHIESNIDAFILASMTFKSSLYEFILMCTLNLFALLIQMLLFLILFIAFNVEYTFGSFVGGFPTLNLFMVVSPTPLGLGVAEGLVHYLISNLGVISEGAFVVVLAYRAITIWIPIIIGFVIFRFISHDPELVEIEKV